MSVTVNMVTVFIFTNVKFNEGPISTQKYDHIWANLAFEL
jgi:hypothetical protein